MHENDGANSIARLSQANTTLDANSQSRGHNKLTVPKWPTYSQLTGWLHRIARNAFSISRYHDQAEIGWVLEVQEKSTEELANTGEARFAFIDNQLAIELEKVIPRQLQVEVNHRLKECAKQKRTLMGRQVLRMSVEYFRVNSYMGVVYSYDNLNELQWFGDNRLTDFLEEWDNIIENLEIALSEEAKRDLLFKKWRIQSFLQQT